jgi:oxalate decarboxylase/phosphoglucose isomerase-like protein (cupin superfamily)
VVLAYQGLTVGEAERGLKFDVTVIPPLTAIPEMAPEYPKTIGHLHTRLPGSLYASPDFYQVAHGQGVLVLQSFDDLQVTPYIVDVQAGDSVLIPPWLAHISVNTGVEPLVFSNICVRRPHLDYASITQCRGAAFYVVASSYSGRYDLILNQSYAERGFVVSESAMMMKPDTWMLSTVGVNKGQPIYGCLERSAVILDALIDPDHYVELFKQTLLPRL